jgi:serine/threonine protein phosphatase PrpC
MILPHPTFLPPRRQHLVPSFINCLKDAASSGDEGTGTSIDHAIDDPATIRVALTEGVRKTENDWFKQMEESRRIDKSGCCACIAYICGRTMYVANVGDCRAVLPMAVTAPWKTVTIDHKPDLPRERERIEAAGGEVHMQTQTVTPMCCWGSRGEEKVILVGPARVQPGGLAVAR